MSSGSTVLDTGPAICKVGHGLFQSLYSITFRRSAHNTAQCARGNRLPLRPCTTPLYVTACQENHVSKVGFAE